MLSCEDSEPALKSGELPGPSRCLQDFVLAPIVFLVAAYLLLLRARHVFGNPVTRSLERIWSSTSTLEKIQATLLLLLVCQSASSMLHAVHADHNGQMFYSALQLVMWGQCLLLVVAETRSGLPRGDHLKLVWLVDLIFRILRLRVAVLNLTPPATPLSSSDGISSFEFMLEIGGFVLACFNAFLGFIHTSDLHENDANAYNTFQDEEEGGREKVGPPASSLSWLTQSSFSWITYLFTLANTKDSVLTFEDLPRIDRSETSDVAFALLFAAWKRERASRPDHPKLLRAIRAVASSRFLRVCLVNVCSLCFTLSGPIIFQAVMRRLESGALQSAAARVDTAMLAVGIGACKAIAAVLAAQVHRRSLRLGGTLRSGLIGLIYRKALVLSAQGRHKFELGALISLVSVDANRVCHSVHALQQVLVGVLQIVVGTALLFALLGPSVFAGLLLLAVFSPINIFVARSQSLINQRIMRLKDKRSNLMDEILQGIRIIKYFAWERSFQAKVLEVRKAELDNIRDFGLYNIISMCIWGSSAMILAVFTFGAYTLNGNELTPSVAFGALVLFNVMNGPLSTIGNLVEQVVQANTALGRLRAFLVAQELDGSYYANCAEADARAEDGMELTRVAREGPALDVQDGVFLWPKKASAEDGEDVKQLYNDSFLGSFRPSRKESIAAAWSSRGQSAAMSERMVEFATTLKQISCSVDPGELCIVTGKVGSGKSSLLSAILGEMKKESGSISLSGRVGFAGQQPWIFNASLRDNITLGAPFNPERYDAIIKVCCLERDLRALPAGEMTEIGEKGINLSGGQKARVALARAVYQDADVYLLDDPLAAVDTHVRERLFRDCIQGFLGGKTRVLTTHHLRYLASADRVVVLDAGSVAAQGAPKDVLSSCPQLVDMAVQPADEADTTDDEVGRGVKRTKRAADGVDSPANAQDRKRSGKTMTKEGMEGEAVSANVWHKYIGAVGWWLVAMFFVLLCGVQALDLARGWWLVRWSGSAVEAIAGGNATQPSNGSDANARAGDDTTASGATSVLDSEEGQGLGGWFLGVYAGLAVMQSFGIAGQTLAALLGALRAARTLHDKMLWSVLRAPVSLFDTTPTGRILNRFAGDMQGIDREMQLGLLNLLKLAVKSALLAVTVAATAPWMLLVGVPTLAGCVWVQRTFQKGCLQVRRLLALARSPMFAHFTETLQGLETIRAFGQQQRSLARGFALADQWMRTMMSLVGSMCWLKVRVECMGSLVVSATAVTAVMSTEGSAGAAMAGLSMSLALDLADTTRELLQQVVTMETHLVAAERVTEYSNLASEPPEVVDACRPPADWPGEGKLQFDSVVMTYRPGLEPALNGLSFETHAGEKIGLVGRTGAGKSSVAVTLFRMATMVSGRVLIDGVDVSTIGLGDLRGKLSIIPQDPVLFSGTIRSNLDPFDTFEDGEVWAALRQVRMEETVQGLPGLLSEPVATGGSNLSVGERQLLCLARALLRRSKVIVMDEATASVDLRTDELIQSAIRHHFLGSTVLTIAHRLDTVVKCDRIMVLDQGRLLEMGTPQALAEDSQSAFYRMVNNPHLKKEMLG